GLALGYILQILVNHKLIKLPVPIDEFRKLLQKVALLFLNPVAIVGAIWMVSIKNVGLVALPFVGLCALLAGGALSLGVAHMLSLPPKKKGAMFGCGSFTNIGTIGALVCFVFLGEAGFALVAIYKLFEELFYYAIGFPIAKYYSRTSREEKIFDRIKSLTRDPFIIVALSSIIIGSLLNTSSVPRPGFFKTVITVFVPLAAIMLLSSIGLAMKFRRVRDYIKECVSVSIIKFALVPALITSLAYLLGFDKINGGLPLKVVIILSSMPVAFNALIPPSIYDLDLDLANSCWFFTTVLLVVVLPVQLFIINQF
ncbi:MAG: hypothetical protein WBM69_27815, partial [Desulfobacterales bacterium]